MENKFYDEAHNYDNAFNLDVKLKNGNVVKQTYRYSKSNDKNEIHIGNFSISKINGEKWILKFPTTMNEGVEKAAKELDLPEDSNLVELDGIEISENGDFEVTTQKGKKITFTPNSLVISDKEFPTLANGETNSITLPSNFHKLLNNTIKFSKLPSEFFTGFAGVDFQNEYDATMQDRGDYYDNFTYCLDDLNVMKIGNQLYTVADSKLTKVESVFHINQPDGSQNIGFVVNQDGKQVAIMHENIKDNVSKFLNFANISIEAWNDPTKHQFEESTLSSQNISTKKYESPAPSAPKVLSSEGIVSSKPRQTVSFDMPVKTKNGLTGNQHYSFGENDNIIKVGDFDIAKGEDGKWSLNFSLDNDNVKEVAKAIALPTEINMATRNVHIPLSKVKIADNGNIEFELETTKDRRTGNTRNFAITPNSVKTAKDEIPTRSNLDSNVFNRYNDVVLPKNFTQLFLGNETTSTITSTLPTEFFQAITQNKEAFPDAKVTEIKNNTNTNRISLLKVGDNLYTQVNSKMMKVESVFNIEQEAGISKVGFIFKKGAEKIARILSGVELDEQMKVMNITGIKFEDWNDKSKHLYDDTTLSTQGLTAKEFETTNKSRAKNLTSYGFGIASEESIDDDVITKATTGPDTDEPRPDTAPDSTRDAAAETDTDKTTEEKPIEPTPVDETPSADETTTAKEKPTDAPTKETPAPPPPAPKPAKEDKNGKFEFSAAPLFYGVGLLLVVLAILTGMVGLLALGAVFMATPKMTEGIINDRASVGRKEHKKSKKKKTKKSLIKQKIHELKLANTILRQRTQCFDAIKNKAAWKNATESLFNKNVLTRKARAAIKKLDISPIDKKQIDRHYSKLTEIAQYLDDIKFELNNPESRLSDEIKAELAPQVELAYNNLRPAIALNDGMKENYYMLSGVKNQAAFSAGSPEKLSTTLACFGITPEDICDASGASTFSNTETIARLNAKIQNNYNEYLSAQKEIMDKDGLLDRQISEITRIMDKDSSKTKTAETTREP